MRLVAFLLQIALFLTAGWAGASYAANDSDDPRWGCWYDGETWTLKCVLLREPATGQLERATAVKSEIDSRLPGLVAVIWGSPERLGTKLISIPLWNEPYDMTFAHQLAESVMCGIRFDCSVLFDQNDDELAPARMAAIRGGEDEATVMAGVAPITLADGALLAR